MSTTSSPPRRWWRSSPWATPHQQLSLLVPLFFLLISIERSNAWPDGAPCLDSTYESMNPLEAVEHQGGLQLSEPPYEIVVEQKCYWRNQPVPLTLQGHNLSVTFKGFVIQPIQWFEGERLGTRIGELLRLDDNGSWQQQCFRHRDSATHSHDEPKRKIKLWWRNDVDEQRTVQFVATVAKSLRQFWVRSIRSPPIPPCKVAGSGPPGWRPPPPDVPPPVKSFKLNTNSIFDSFDTSRPEQQQNVQPQSSAFIPPPQPVDERPAPVFFVRPTRPPPMPTTTEPQRLNHVIPLTSMAPLHPHREPSNERIVEGEIQQPFSSSTPASFTSFEGNNQFAPRRQFRPRRPRPRRPQQQQQFQQQQQQFQQPQFQQQQQFQQPQQQFQQPQQQFFRQPGAQLGRRIGFRQRQQQQFNVQPVQQQQPPPTQQPVFQSTAECRDVETPALCAAWSSFCPYNGHVRNFCRQTCRLC